MDLLDYRQIILSESDEEIRRLERLFDAGDYDAGFGLVGFYSRIGNTAALIRLLPKLPKDRIDDERLLRLREIGIASQSIKHDVDVLDGYEVVKYIAKNVLTTKPSSDSRAVMMDTLKPYFRLLVQDPETAFASAYGFMFIWEEVEDQRMASLALAEISKDTNLAMKYFEHFSTVVGQRDRQYWPWRFGDPLGDDVLSRFASNPRIAMKFARLASKTDPTKEPWPSNTPIGLSAILKIARDPKRLDEYLDLPQGSAALKNSKIRAAVERIQSQNYW